MKKTLKWLCIGTAIFILIILLFRHAEPASKELFMNNKSAVIRYEKKKWKETSSNNIPIIHIRSEKKAVFIGGGRFRSLLNTNDYVKNFKEVMKGRSINATCEEGVINGFPLLTFTENKGNYNITYSVLVAKDGPGFYEITFACVSDLCEKYKNDAYDVLKTFSILLPSKEDIIYDPELSKGMAELDSLAGINKEAVRAKITVGKGNELVGEWGGKDNSGKILPILIIKSDNTYIWYKSPGDESNINSGIWSYPEDRIIILNSKNLFVNGKRVDRGNFVTNLEILNLEKTNNMTRIYIRNLQTLTQYHLFRTDLFRTD